MECAFHDLGVDAATDDRTLAIRGPLSSNTLPNGSWILRAAISLRWDGVQWDNVYVWQMEVA
jgi:hypothetical protein